jgi:hypothetical protein
MKDEAQKAEEAGLLDEIGQPLLAKDQSREKMVNVTDDSPRIPTGAQGKNRNKNKTTGSSGITGVPGLTTSAQIPGVSSFPEAPSVGSNSSVVDFGAQITVMQESLNQVQLFWIFCIIFNGSRLLPLFLLFGFLIMTVGN